MARPMPSTKPAEEGGGIFSEMSVLSVKYTAMKTAVFGVTAMRFLNPMKFDLLIGALFLLHVFINLAYILRY